MFAHDLVNAAARLSAERVLDSLVLGFVLAAFAWLLLRLIPRQNSATRFAIWFSALLATAILPWLNLGPTGTGLVSSLAPAPQALFSLPASWALYLFAAWMVVASLALARVGAGLLQLRRLRRQCRPMEVDGATWREMAARLCPARPVEILTSDGVHVPTAIGFLKPAVVLPARLLQELTTAELNQVLVHELAHLRRWDDWTNLAQKFIKALLFFHPAVWWVEQRISLEREMACDEAVLAETRSPRAYAQCLAVLAEKSVARRSAALAQAAVNRIRQTSLRVAQILDADRSKAVQVRKSAVAVLGAFACACAVVIWQAPQLVAFDDPPPAPPALAASVAPPLNPAQWKRTVEHSNPAQPRRSSAPAVLAKASGKRGAAELAAIRSTSAESRQMWETAPQVIEARAEAHPAIATGVVVIIVDDPALGPTPVVWRFAVWQVTLPHKAQAGPGVSQKNT